MFNTMPISQIPLGKKIKHEEELWEIVAIDFSSDKVQLVNQDYKGTIWLSFHEVKSENIRHY